MDKDTRGYSLLMSTMGFINIIHMQYLSLCDLHALFHLDCPCFTNEVPEAQGGGVTCPGSQLAQPEFKQKRGSPCNQCS